ncbi:MAG: DEAD/DEAH box helicase family protein [archaeon]|nr:DEAD/DEAH box helicase family protein [archaeon]
MSISFISHPKIRPGTIEERVYQKDLAAKCLESSTLVVLPTGLGKTVIATLAIAGILEQGKSALVLAPTKPLVEQHYTTMCDFFVDVKIGVMNGNTHSSERVQIIKNNDIIVCTPQVINNDLKNEKYDLSRFGLIVFDEAHRAIGNYAYVNIASYSHSLSMGITASPGSNKSKMKEVCQNLNIRKVEYRNANDSDVTPYTFGIHVEKIFVNLPNDIKKSIGLLDETMNPYLKSLKYLGFLDSDKFTSVKHMLLIGEIIRKRISESKSRDSSIIRGLIAQSVCIKIQHAINLVGTQGTTTLRSYIKKVNESTNRVSKLISSSSPYKELQNILRKTKIEHPKFGQIMQLVNDRIKENNSSKIMIFSQYRETCELLTNKLSRIYGARVTKLIGQSNGGLKQKEQIRLLNDFRSGVFNILVSTSVGEEGLDVENTDMVIFYEPVPSVIRTIQRKGRTGRKNFGRVFVLIARNTADEIFEEINQEMERNMKNNMEFLNTWIRNEHTEKQLHLSDY